jgi:hypothetical protein
MNKIVEDMFKAYGLYMLAPKSLKKVKLDKLDSAIDKFLDYVYENNLEEGM